jgi:MFS family permease
VVLTPLVSRTFVQKRGLALSIVQAANGFGRAGSLPVVQFLTTTDGWRRAYLVLAALMAVVIVPLARGFRAGASAAPGPATETPVTRDTVGHDWTVREAMATPHFWLLFLVYLLTGLGSFFVSLHQLAFAADVGFDTLHAASILGMGSFLSVEGTIFTGTISDYIGREVSAIVAYGISIIGVFAALFISSADQT